MGLICQQYETDLDVQYTGNSCSSMTKNASILDRERGYTKENNEISKFSDGNNGNSAYVGPSISPISSQAGNSTDTNVDVTSEAYHRILSQPLPLRSKIMTSLVGLFVAVGGLLFGYDTGLINSIAEMPVFIEKMTGSLLGLSNGQLSILVSFLSLGTFLGSLCAPVISDKYGRKPTIIVSNLVLFIIGTSLQVTAQNLKVLILGRVISGVGIGLISAVVPLYQAEAAEKSMRGAIISSYQWAITIGLLMSNGIAQSTQSRNDLSAYRIPLALQYIWSVFLAIGMIFLPESPRYFIIKDEINKAAKSLSFLRGIPYDDPRLLEELVEIKATYDYEASFGQTTIWDCFKSSKSRPKQSLRISTGIVIQIFQQFSGINFIFYYGLRFFYTAGIDKPHMISLITYAVNVVFNILGMFFIEYFGRRNVLLYGGIVMTLSNFIVASVGTTIKIHRSVNIVITFICTFIAAFASTWGGVVWVISAELFPLGVRSKSTAICTAANWISNFICSFMTPYIISSQVRHASGVFFIWGTINALAVIVVYFTVYETSGLRLEEITELYRESESCFTSKKYNKILRERPILESVYPPVNLLNDIQRRNQENDASIQEKIEMETVVNGERNTINNSDDQDAYANNIHYSNSNNNNGIFSGNSLGEIDMYNSKAVSRKEFNKGYPYNNDEIDNLTCKKYDEITNNFMDLGNGLGLNTYNRGPPSILSESSIEYDGVMGLGNTTIYYSDSSCFSDGKHKNMLKETNMAFPDSSSHTSNSTNYEMFLTIQKSKSPGNSDCNGETDYGRCRSSINTVENSSNNSYSDVDWGQYLRKSSMVSSSDAGRTNIHNNGSPYSQFHSTLSLQSSINDLHIKNSNGNTTVSNSTSTQNTKYSSKKEK